MLSQATQDVASASRKKDESTFLFPPKVEISGSHRGIKHIDLSRSIPYSSDLQLLHRITLFDLSHNELRVLKDLHPLSNLQQLDVSYNRISSITHLPSSIVKIDLSHNDLPRLDGLCDLVHLKELNVSFNKLTNLTGLHSGIPLKVLCAEHNGIQHTLGVDEMTSLEVLSLSHNQIRNADELHFLPSCPSLRELTLTENPVTRHKAYRTMVRQLQPQVQLLDGERIKIGQREKTEEEQRKTTNTDRKTEVTNIHLVAGKALPRERQSIATASSLPSAAIASRESVSLAKEELTSASPSPFYDEKNSRSREQKASRSWEKLNEKVEERKITDYHPIPTEERTKKMDPSSSLSAVGASGPIPSGFLASETTSSGYAKAFQTTLRHKTNPHASPSSTLCSSSFSSPSLFSETTRKPSLLPQRTTHRSSSSSPSSFFATTSAPNDTSILSSPSSSSPSPPHYSITAQLHDALVGKEQAEKENTMLRAQLKKLMDATKANRRLIGDLTRDVSQLREERTALIEREEAHKVLVQRLKRHMKGIEAHHKTDVRTWQEQCERLKVLLKDPCQGQALPPPPPLATSSLLLPPHSFPDASFSHGTKEQGNGRKTPDLQRIKTKGKENGSEGRERDDYSSRSSMTPLCKTYGETSPSFSSEKHRDGMNRPQWSSGGTSLMNSHVTANPITRTTAGAHRTTSGESELVKKNEHHSFFSTEEREEAQLLPKCSVFHSLSQKQNGKSLHECNYKNSTEGSECDIDDEIQTSSQETPLDTPSISAVIELTPLPHTPTRTSSFSRNSSLSAPLCLSSYPTGKTINESENTQAHGNAREPVRVSSKAKVVHTTSVRPPPGSDNFSSQFFVFSKQPGSLSSSLELAPHTSPIGSPDLESSVVESSQPAALSTSTHTGNKAEGSCEEVLAEERSQWGAHSDTEYSSLDDSIQATLKTGFNAAANTASTLILQQLRGAIKKNSST